MSNYFQYEDKYGNVAYLTERGNGNVYFGVRESTDRFPRSTIVPRAALMEWLSGGKPETQTVVITDAMLEAGAKVMRERSMGEGSWETATERAKRGECDIFRPMLTAALAAGQVPVWEPCEREDIRKGERYRVEDKYGAIEAVADEDFGVDHACSDQRWFRIPAPVETAEWPDGKPGDLFWVDFTDWQGKRHNDEIVRMTASKDYLVSFGKGSIYRDEVDDHDKPATLHKVTRLKVVEA